MKTNKVVTKTTITMTSEELLELLKDPKERLPIYKEAKSKFEDINISTKRFCHTFSHICIDRVSTVRDETDIKLTIYKFITSVFPELKEFEVKDKTVWFPYAYGTVDKTRVEILNSIIRSMEDNQ